MSLPDHPDLNWLRKQAKRLLKELREVNPAAQLADAQFDLAKQYGFSSWRALKGHVDSVTVEPLVTDALEQAERSTPAVKAAALLHIARVLNAFDRGKAEQVLDRGIAAAAALREPDRSVILAEAVSLAAAVSPARAIRLAPMVPDDGFGGPSMSKVLSDMRNHGHHAAVSDYLIGASSGGFPFDAALQAIRHADDDATRIQILRSAIRAFRAQDSHRDGHSLGGPHGFPHLFVRWWRLLPVDEARTVIRELVEKILADPDQRMRASWNDVRFSSSREHRLFEIFGPLRHLDPELAQSLVRTHSQLAVAAERYPDGHESMQAASIRPATDLASPATKQLDYMSVGGRLVAMPDAVRSEFKEAFDLALRLHAGETDSRHPNDAPQECWPSTQEFRTILYKAGQHEGRVAVRYLDRIPDPNLRLFAQIELAAALLGLPQIGGRGISPGPGGFRQSMRSPAAQGSTASAPPSFHVPPPTCRPDIAPSYDVHIRPTRRALGEGPSGGSGPDFWTIEGASLRSVIAKLYQVPETRVDVPASIEDRRYDFTLALPRRESRETMERLMREGIEKQFRVMRESRSMEVEVLTAPNGINAREAYEADHLSSGGSVGFFEVSTAEQPPIPEGFMLADIMNLHEVPPEHSLSADEDMRMIKALLRAQSFAFGSGVGISSISQSMTMTELCELLESGFDRPIVDETRLGGTYDINVHSQSNTTRDFLQVLCDQLGLTLAPATRDVVVLAVRER
jgi:uncharacterized protein (TIGR03435 family)